jgi:hypothetical protein
MDIVEIKSHDVALVGRAASGFLWDTVNMAGNVRNNDILFLQLFKHIFPRNPRVLVARKSLAELS